MGFIPMALGVCMTMRMTIHRTILINFTAVDTLIANKGKVSFTVPSCIAPGSTCLKFKRFHDFHLSFQITSFESNS